MKNGHTETGASDEMTLMSKEDLYLFNEGSHFHLYRKFGAHPVIRNGIAGTSFSVWAPDAEQVSVIGSFNDWKKDAHGLCRREESGIWEGFLPGVGKGTLYKFHIRSRFNGYEVEKTDPFAFFNEIPPKTASIVWDLDYTWRDEKWMASRNKRNALDA
ncbi:MAG: 1,4-alpha-glucan branching enzyme, partial [Nitrospirota bacterium]|nr:1,4-alpha-glucan branching enzyme [Nitrospirota bacterium]